jgi:hypothetical protein
MKPVARSDALLNVFVAACDEVSRPNRTNISARKPHSNEAEYNGLYKLSLFLHRSVVAAPSSRVQHELAQIQGAAGPFKTGTPKATGASSGPVIDRGGLSGAAKATPNGGRRLHHEF